MIGKRTLAVAAVALGIVTAVQAQELPRGRWWRRPEIAKAVSLTEEQQKRLDAISRDAAPDLIDAKAAVDKAAVALRNELEQSTVSREAVQKVAAKLNDARGRLFERELMMLVDMRGVLNDQQWTKIRNKMEQQRPRDGRSEMAPPPPGGEMRAPRGPNRPMAPPPEERRP